MDALLLPIEIQDFLRHSSSFKLTSQGILICLWTMKCGAIHSLIFIGADALHRILRETHEFAQNSAAQSAHLGQTKTMSIIGQTILRFLHALNHKQIRHAMPSVYVA